MTEEENLLQRRCTGPLITLSLRGIADELPSLQDCVIWGSQCISQDIWHVSQLESLQQLHTVLGIMRPSGPHLCWLTQHHLLPFAPFSLCFSPTGLLWVIWVKLCSASGSSHILFLYLECPSPCFICSPKKLSVILSPKYPPRLGLHHFHLGYSVHGQ